MKLWTSVLKLSVIILNIDILNTEGKRQRIEEWLMT